MYVHKMMAGWEAAWMDGERGRVVDGPMNGLKVKYPESVHFTFA